MFGRFKRRQQKNKQPEVIISLTSRPGRIDKMRPMMDSLKAQTVKPDRIIVWLDEDEFPDGRDEVERELSYLDEYGAEIQWIRGGLKSHNKYWWVFQRYPDAIVITIDDDLFYSELMVEELLASYHRHPEAVASLRGHKVTLNEQGDIAGYNDWIGEQRETLDTPSHRLFFSDGAGAIYPPHIFGKNLFDEELLRELCINNDDIWLNIHLMDAGTPVIVTGTSPYLHYVPDTQEDGLWQENVTRNDSIFAAMFAAFPKAHDNLVEAVKNEP